MGMHERCHRGGRKDGSLIHHSLHLCLTRLTKKSFKKMKSCPTSNRALNLVFARARNLKIK